MWAIKVEGQTLTDDIELFSEDIVKIGRKIFQIGDINHHFVGQILWEDQLN